MGVEKAPQAKILEKRGVEKAPQAKNFWQQGGVKLKNRVRSTGFLSFTPPVEFYPPLVFRDFGTRGGGKTQGIPMMYTNLRKMKTRMDSMGTVENDEKKQDLR